MPALYEGEQHCDKPVSVQPLAIILQAFLTCTLSVLLTPGRQSQTNRLTSPQKANCTETAGCSAAVGLF